MIMARTLATEANLLLLAVVLVAVQVRHRASALLGSIDQSFASATINTHRRCANCARQHSCFVSSARAPSALRHGWPRSAAKSRWRATCKRSWHCASTPRTTFARASTRCSSSAARPRASRQPCSPPCWLATRMSESRSTSCGSRSFRSLVVRASRVGSSSCCTTAQHQQHQQMVHERAYAIDSSFISHTSHS